MIKYFRIFSMALAVIIFAWPTAVLGFIWELIYVGFIKGREIALDQAIKAGDDLGLRKKYN